MSGPAPNKDDLPSSALRPRTIILGVLFGIPLSILFLWLAIRGVSFSQVWDALASVSVLYVLLATPLLLGIVVFQGLRWRALVGGEHPLTRRTYIALSWFGVGVSAVIPGRPGDIARGLWQSRLAHVPAARGLASVAVDRAVDVISLVVIVLICLPFVPHPDWLITLAIIGVILGVVLMAILVAAWWAANHSAQAQRWLSRASEGSWLRRQAAALVEGMGTVRTGRQVAVVFAWSTLAWISWTAGAWLLALSLGAEVTPGGTLLVAGVVGLGSAIPSSPGQIGTTQWLSVVSLALLGVSRADGLAFSILLQLVLTAFVAVTTPLVSWWLASRAPRVEG